MTHEEKLKDIRENPLNHHHDFEGLQQCCFVDGSISLMLITAHEGLATQQNYYGSNNRCDVSAGPCSCGAWH